MKEPLVKEKKTAKTKTIKIESKIGREEIYILKLFVTGLAPYSRRAIINIKAICEQHLKGNYELEIIDLYQQQDLALSEKIIAVPLLVRKFPLPERRLVGDLSDTQKALTELDLNNQ